jgi:ABC-type uncharacterized transport system permease subunit
MFLLWLRVAAVFYAIASVAALPAVLYGRPRWQKVWLPAALTAFLFHFVSVAEMLNSAHHWIPVGMREVNAILGLLISAIFLLIWLLYRTISFGVFALPLAFLLVLISAVGPDKYTFTSPGLRSGWLFTHIAALLAAYAALLFSMLASFLYLVQERRLKSKVPSRLLTWLPPLETMDKIAYFTLLVGFPCMTIGLLVGSVVAQEQVGPGYFLDPKVIASFGMWLLYIILLLVRQSQGLRGKKAAYVSSLVFLVMLGVLAANTFSAVHRFMAP